MSQVFQSPIAVESSGQAIIQGFRAELNRRLWILRGGRTIRRFAQDIGVHHETLRRLLQGQPPSAEVLANICLTHDVSANWLLLGIGPANARRLDAQGGHEVGALRLTVSDAEHAIAVSPASITDPAEVLRAEREADPPPPGNRPLP